MKKLFSILLLLGLGAIALPGCEVEVDDDPVSETAEDVGEGIEDAGDAVDDAADDVTD